MHAKTKATKGGRVPIGLKLPEDLVNELRLRAEQEKRLLQVVVETAIRKGLGQKVS